MVSKTTKLVSQSGCLANLRYFNLELIFLYLAPSKVIQIPESGKLFAYRNQSPGLWNHENRNSAPGVNLIKLLHVQVTSVAIVLESENNYYSCTSKLDGRLESGIQVLLTRNPVNPTTGIQNPRTSWITLH